MKNFECSDGFVTKSISTDTALEAAEIYAIITSDVTVIDIDNGRVETFRIDRN